MKLTKYVFVGLILFLLDRITKLWALHACATKQVFTSWLSCNVALNRGVAWSFFHSDAPLVFAAVTGMVIFVTFAVAAHAYQRLHTERPIWAETLVIAGAAGNVWDRLWYGGVVDFIALSYKDFVWPLFNGADIMIVLGVMILFVEIFFEGNNA